jgi:hypothetical protein
MDFFGEEGVVFFAGLVFGLAELPLACDQGLQVHVPEEIFEIQVGGADHLSSPEGWRGAGYVDVYGFRSHQINHVGFVRFFNRRTVEFEFRLFDRFFTLLVELREVSDETFGVYPRLGFFSRHVVVHEDEIREGIFAVDHLTVVSVLAIGVDEFGRECCAAEDDGDADTSIVEYIQVLFHECCGLH